MDEEAKENKEGSKNKKTNENKEGKGKELRGSPPTKETLNNLMSLTNNDARVKWNGAVTYKMQILHINLNHTAGAHDLLLQTITEWKIGVAVISEPYKVEYSRDWIADEGNNVAIFRNGKAASPLLRLVIKGCGFLIAHWGDINIIGYAPPSRPIDWFRQLMGQISKEIPRLQNSNNVIMIGDFNAKLPYGNRNLLI